MVRSKIEGITCGPETPADDHGHSLLELLVVLALFSLAIVGSRVFLNGLEAVEERGAAQILQTAFAASQLRQQWQANTTKVELGSSQVALVSDCGPRELYASLVIDPLDANVSTWRQLAGGLIVTISGPLASPDSGGTVSVGQRSAVVIRPESGFTRRVP